MSSQQHTVTVALGHLLTSDQIDRGLAIVDRYVAYLEARQALIREEFDDEKAHRARLAAKRAEEEAQGEPPSGLRFRKRSDAARLDRLIDVVELLIEGRPGAARASVHRLTEEPELEGSPEAAAPMQSPRRTDPLPTLPASPRPSLPSKPASRTDARGNPV